jgi:PAS domain S-box-containing protein
MRNESNATSSGASDVKGDKLYVINGPMGGHVFNLKEEITIVGRAYDCNIQIKDSSISRRHVEIIRRGDMFLVKDLKSRNGTWINGISIAAGNEIEVAEGVPIALGETFISLGKEYFGGISPNEYSIDLSGREGERTKNLLYKDRRITDRENLELIYEVSTILMQSLDINEICKKILESLFNCLKRVDGGAVLLIDENTGEIKEITARTKKKNIKLDFSRTIVNRVINDGKAIAMSDTSHEDVTNLSDSIGKMRIRSIMCVPLISKAATRGVIYVHSVGRPNAFRKDDLFLLTGLSSPAALAIENALLYSESRRAQEALEALNSELEQRIKGRTAELSASNALLKKEVAEHRETEEALSKSEESYRFLVENANDIIYKADSTGHFTFFNPIAVKATKYSEQELTGKHFTELMRQDYCEKAEKFYVLQSVNKTPSTYYEFPMITKDGEEVWLGQQVQLIIEANQVIGVHAIARDITGRKRAEKALQYRIEFEKLITSISTQFINLPTDEIDEGTNRALKEIGEFSGADRSYLFLFFEDGRKMVNTHEWCAEGVEPYIEKLKRLSVDAFPWWTDRLRQFEIIDIAKVDELPSEAHAEKERLKSQGVQSLVVVPMVSSGSLLGFLGFDWVREQKTWTDDIIALLKILGEIFVNVLERKRAEEVLKESGKKLRFLSSHLLTVQEKEQRRISLELHDDLGQSLAVLKLHLQSIHEKMPQENRTIKKDLAASLNSVDQIIESVRRLSRDLSPSILEDLGLSAALRWLVREFKERFKIKFTSSIPEIDNLFPREGQTLIYRIFQEAFTNIGKHAQANHVSVVIKKEERRVSFLVEDDGIGFDVEKQDVLDHTEKGMGLSAMDERVRMLGGQLEVSSQRNQGTTISFIIPIEKGGNR